MNNEEYTVRFGESLTNLIDAIGMRGGEFEAMADRWDADSEQQPDKKVTARPGDVGRFLPE